MLIKSFVAGPWQTNCYIIAPSTNSECIIVDPGQNAVGAIKEILEEQKLRPIAVMATHGHIDHMWSVFPLAKGYEIPAFIHAADRHLLSNPASGLSSDTQNILQQMLGPEDIFLEPDEVIEISDRHSLKIAGMTLEVRHTPGHTAGSVIFCAGDNRDVVFTGDTLFAGAIGRVDLPGSSPTDMNNSLKNVILDLPDTAKIYPGHGPSTRMDIEIQTNQYLIRTSQGFSAV